MQSSTGHRPDDLSRRNCSYALAATAHTHALLARELALSRDHKLTRPSQTARSHQTSTQFSLAPGQAVSREMLAARELPVQKKTEYGTERSVRFVRFIPYKIIKNAVFSILARAQYIYSS